MKGYDMFKTIVKAILVSAIATSASAGAWEDYISSQTDDSTTIALASMLDASYKYQDRLIDDLDEAESALDYLNNNITAATTALSDGLSIDMQGYSYGFAQQSSNPHKTASFSANINDEITQLGSINLKEGFWQVQSDIRSIVDKAVSTSYEAGYNAGYVDGYSAALAAIVASPIGETK